MASRKRDWDETTFVRKVVPVAPVPQDLQRREGERDVCALHGKWADPQSQRREIQACGHGQGCRRRGSGRSVSL